ncbi:MAG: hypothetical protein KDA75_13420 [Planctomycetaceae bacterium]|nr:hypothetical protein [Planctomycetaceae bacterium]
MFDSIGRIFLAALAIVLIACGVEVALRVREFQALDQSTGPQSTGLPREHSRSTCLELPSAWYGVGRNAESGEPLPLRVNALGLRGPELSAGPAPGTLRIICLGDEQTLADGLPEENLWTAGLSGFLEKSAGRPVEVINAGLPGGCPLTEYIHYRRLLQPLAPNVVILELHVSDAAEDARLRPHLRNDGQGTPVAVVHPSLEASESPVARLAENFALVRWFVARAGSELTARQGPVAFEDFQTQLLAWNPEAGATPGEAVPRVLQPIAHLKTLLDNQGATLVVCAFPNAWQASELLRSSDRESGENNLLNRPALTAKAACQAWGVEFIDLTAVVLQSQRISQLYLPNGSGLSTAGHALLAEEVARRLTASPAAEPSAAPAGVADRLDVFGSPQ